MTTSPVPNGDSNDSNVNRNSSILSSARSIQDFLNFKKRRVRGEHKVRTLVPDHLLKSEHYLNTDEHLMQIKKLHETYAKNKIRTTKYTILSFIPKNLFEQFHRFANVYFVFVILLNFVPQVGAIQPFVSMGPVIVILLIQALKDSIEDYGRYKNDKAVNHSVALVFNSADNKYHEVRWSELKVGDIVRVLCNSVIPADVLLLNTSDQDGLCFIETSNIDGESNLKQRMIVRRHWGDLSSNEFHPQEFKSIVECQTPSNEIYKFHGNIIPPNGGDKIPINSNNLLLRGCVIRNTDYVEGIVIYAGHETKAMLNNNGPRYKRSKLERRMNTDVVYCVVLLIVMCLFGAIANGIWADYMKDIPSSELFVPKENDENFLEPGLSGFYMFWTMVILLQVLIPISLYVSIELVKWAQVYMINNDLDLYHAETDTPMQCRALNIPEDLGQIQFVFSDKTGTLTENQMVFRRCTVGGVDYPHAANAARIENSEPTPGFIHPGDPNLQRTDSVRSYRRPHSGSIRPHMRHRNFSGESRTNHEKGDAREGHEGRDAHDGGDTVDGHTVTFATSRSAPNSPLGSRKNRMSTRRPASHHRRNISSVSAREVLTTIASEEPGNTRNPDPGAIVNQQFDEASLEDLETDVTPDPVLIDEFKSSSKQRGSQMAPDLSRVMDFFINLAICNTVVLSNDQKAEQQTAVVAPTGDNYRSFSSNSTPSGGGTPTKGGNTPEAARRNGNTNNSANVVGSEDASGDSNSRASVDLGKVRYEAESPDEAALVYAAYAYGCVLTNRSSAKGRETVTVTLPGNCGKLVFEVLQVLPFDSQRKRMSVLVRDPRTNEITLYCKGADSAVLSQLADSKEHVHFDVSPKDGEVSPISSNANSVVSDTKRFLDAYARSGLRTLCISKKVVSESEYAEFVRAQREADHSLDSRDELRMRNFLKMETELELLGATGIEDKLQEGVPETIESLRQAGIQVWVVTGDKQETAINIGYSCRLIHAKDEVIVLNAETREAFDALLETHVKDQQMKRGSNSPPENRSPSILPFDVSFILPNTTTYPSIDDRDQPALVLIIDGKTLGFALHKDCQKKFVELARRCRSVLCCRATPIQKGEIVKLIRDELHVMTLAIGDGANDVSMIQVADVGIGLSGQEGMQAVMSSDYALAQFRFLKKLLLVHGHWNYARLSNMVLYFFYKNAAFVFLIFWYQFLCGYSGANMIEQLYLLGFSLIFTSVPPLVNGVLDRDITEQTLMRKPHLYMQGIRDELYQNRTFWFNILDAVYQSVILFFFLYLTYSDTNVGIIEWGTPVTTAAVLSQLMHLGIETKTWTWINWVAQLGSVAVFFVFSVVYNILCPACLPPSNPYYIMPTVIQTGNFWFGIILCVIVALAPRYFVRAIQSSLFASECQKERIREKNRVPSPPSTESTSTGSSSTHHNPTFLPERVPGPQGETPARPSHLAAFGPKTGSGFNYGGSTPDLTTTSPFYRRPSYSTNNSNNTDEDIVMSQERQRAPVDAPSTSSNSSGVHSHSSGRGDPTLPSSNSTGFDNQGYFGLSDSDNDSFKGYESDTGEQQWRRNPPGNVPAEPPHPSIPQTAWGGDPKVSFGVSRTPPLSDNHIPA